MLLDQSLLIPVLNSTFFQRISHFFKDKSYLRSVSRVNFDDTFSLHKQVCQTPAGRPGGLPLQGLSSCSLSLKGELICFSPASPRTTNDPHLHLLQPNCLIDPERVPHLDKHTHTNIYQTNSLTKTVCFSKLFSFNMAACWLKPD